MTVLSYPPSLNQNVYLGDDEMYKEKFLSRKLIFGTTIGAALFFMLVGVIFWGGFNTAMEATNTMDFCISCHEMEENVYTEYKETIHYTNGSGVRATCSDCHVPDPWVHKVVRKIEASNEVFHKILGSVDTPEKFNAKRLYLAKRVWNTMKSTDSRECRNCHDFSSMNPEHQKPRARKQHMNAMESGNTCIDCHKGIAHHKPHPTLTDDELENLEQADPEHVRPVPQNWLNYEKNKTEAKKAEAEKMAAQLKLAAAAPVKKAASASAKSSGKVNWKKVPARKIVVFYPGQSSMEWVQKGSDHGGARPFKAGDRCFDCHDEEAADIGKKIVTGEKLEPTPIKGKRGSIPVKVQAAHDKQYLYMKFQWEDTKHVPVSFASGGKMDAKNRMKLAIMFATDDVEYADRAGCWGTCHHDANTMPDAPKGKEITKYLTESRTDIEIKGRDGKPRGGWDKLKTDELLNTELKAGHFMDVLRYNSGSKKVEDGHILSNRKMSGGQGAEFKARLINGLWTVEMKRKLVSGKPGDISISKGHLYNFGFAIHDDYTSARFHHVSLGYKLALDNPDAEVNAVDQ